ncbi:MAG TPA: lysophospholipid acyltransferase family protein [Steroidobacteraceae bacterium]|nr:lysophospholipid acyltransferase family protein [Steroidobacteraceae bacterium]
MSRSAKKFARALYGAWSLSLFALLIGVATVLAFVVPRLTWRRAITGGCARLWLRLAGLRVRTTGLETLPAGSCVLVANHSSYLDGIVMVAMLPRRFSFVVKREAASMPVVGRLLRRIGSEFVDRHTKGGRQRDARRVVERAEQGHSLVFFPEGTFDSTVGLKRFHFGAFVAAARGGIPVVPTVIHGARRALPSHTHVPRPGRLHIEVLPPLGGHDETPQQLRDAARALMLERLGEPDVAREHESAARGDSLAPMA